MYSYSSLSHSFIDAHMDSQEIDTHDDGLSVGSNNNSTQTIFY